MVAYPYFNNKMEGSFLILPAVYLTFLPPQNFSIKNRLSFIIYISPIAATEFCVGAEWCPKRGHK